MATKAAKAPGLVNKKITPRHIHDRMLFHLAYTRCKDWRSATEYDKLTCLCLAIRDFAVQHVARVVERYGVSVREACEELVDVLLHAEESVM